MGLLTTFKWVESFGQCHLMWLSNVKWALINCQTSVSTIMHQGATRTCPLVIRVYRVIDIHRSSFKLQASRHLSAFHSSGSSSVPFIVRLGSVSLEKVFFFFKSTLHFRSKLWIWRHSLRHPIPNHQPLLTQPKKCRLHHPLCPSWSSRSSHSSSPSPWSHSR